MYIADKISFTHLQLEIHLQNIDFDLASFYGNDETHCCMSIWWLSLQLAHFEEFSQKTLKKIQGVSQRVP